MNFVSDEKAQGAMEYILLAGGIIVAVVIIFGIYNQMTKTAAIKWNTSAQNASNKMENLLTNAMGEMVR